MSRILRYLACLFMLIFAGNALAAGYSCPSYKKYTSCASGYYMTSSSSSTTCNTTAKAGNACRPCSVMGSNYTCAGGTACPKLNSVTCSAGYYLKANATSCSPCGGNNYYCKGGTFNVSSSAQGRNTVSSGYYSTGGTSTTRTGQAACGGNNYYCSSGVRYTVSTGYYSTGGGSTTRTGQKQCEAGYKCSSGVRTACSGSLQYQNAVGQTSCKTVSDGYYKSSNSAQTQCPANYRDGTGAANINACKTSCADGTYVATANAACTSVGTGYYRAAHTVNYGSTSTRSQCPANYRDGAAAPAQNGCKTSCAGGTYVATANAACTSVGTGYYKGAHTVNYGSTSTRSQCPANYRDGAAASAQNGCKTSCAGGTYVATANAACTSVGTGYYRAAHTVNYGSTSTRSQCPANYRDGAAASAQNGCKTSCAGGTYVATANAACTSVGTGYYKGAHTVNYGSTSTRSQCPANYRDGAAASAQSGCKTSCDGGTYVATANAACTSVGTGYYKGAHTVNYGSTSTRSQCPSGYRDGAATSAQSGCKMDVEAGHYVGTANSATQSTCAAGTYKAAHTITYGSTSSCSACSGRTKYSAAGASACRTVDSGYYTTGCNTSGNNCTGQSQCTGATYCSGGVQNSCPAQTAGWTRNSGTGWTTYTQCNQTRAATEVSSYCSAGQLKQNATSATAWGASTISTAFQAKAGAYVNGQTCSQCAAGDYCTGGTAAPKDCPSGYPNSAAGAGAITSCYSNSKSRAWTGSQVNGAVPANCSAVTEWGTCSKPACSYVAYANSAGTGDGTIKSGCSTNNANCTKPVVAVSADAGYYDAGTTCSACPSGYPNSDDDNEGGITKCYSNTKSRAWTGSQTPCAKPTGCYSVTCNACSEPACSYVAYANSAGTGDGTIKSGCSSNNEACQQTVNTVTANAGRYVSGKTCPACAVGTFQGSNDSTATSCSVCSGNTYAASTGMSSCSACPSGYTISGTAASNHDAKSDCSITCAAGTRVVTADAACTTPTGSWYTASHSVTAGSTTPTTTVKACLTNYSTPNTTARTDHDASTDCKISCAAGTRITTANATSCTTPAGNWYVGAHSVAQGSISSYSNCLTNYTISGTAATNHDTASDCKISCGGGSYIATANNTTCSDVGAGYWAAASTVSQGSAGVRNACDDGLTTIGSGAGADEVGDCGRVLNVNGEKIYLRSERKTTPSLNVSINGTTFYGNMGASGIGALKLNSGGTTYSVYDDSME